MYILENRIIRRGAFHSQCFHYGYMMLFRHDHRTVLDFFRNLKLECAPNIYSLSFQI